MHLASFLWRFPFEPHLHSKRWLNLGVCLKTKPPHDHESSQKCSYYPHCPRRICRSECQTKSSILWSSCGCNWSFKKKLCSASALRNCFPHILEAHKRGIHSGKARLRFCKVRRNQSQMSFASLMSFGTRFQKVLPSQRNFKEPWSFAANGPQDPFRGSLEGR